MITLLASSHKQMMIYEQMLIYEQTLMNLRQESVNVIGLLQTYAQNFILPEVVVIRQKGV